MREATALGGSLHLPQPAGGRGIRECAAYGASWTLRGWELDTQTGSPASSLGTRRNLSFPGHTSSSRAVIAGPPRSGVAIDCVMTGRCGVADCDELVDATVRCGIRETEGILDRVRGAVPRVGRATNETNSCGKNCCCCYTPRQSSPANVGRAPPPPCRGPAGYGWRAAG